MYWAKATAPDGTTYIGIVSGNDARQVHCWLNIDGSQPNTYNIQGIAVISIPPGNTAVESVWGTARLSLNKYLTVPSENQPSVWVRKVKLHVNSLTSFMVDRWMSGSPQFIFFPGINRYPQHLNRCLPATLTQVSQLRTPTFNNRASFHNNNNGNEGSGGHGNNNRGNRGNNNKGNNRGNKRNRDEGAA